MLRYLFALIPGILLFSVWYFVKSDEVNFFLRFVGRLSFVYLTLAFAVTPIMELTKKHGIAPYRRVFGVLAFLLAMAHGAIYFDMEYTYQNTFFVWEHFKELDILWIRTRPAPFNIAHAEIVKLPRNPEFVLNRECNIFCLRTVPQRCVVYFNFSHDARFMMHDSRYIF